MNTFFIEFRDPLFSIIIFFVIIFMITFFSYWWSRYKRKEDSKYLDNFLQQFQTLPSKEELRLLISGGELSEKSWLLLASSYFKSGDYEKSIDIYNELLKVGSSNVKETMFLLGKTYFKAGFLERSKQIFLEILKKNPRTPQALHYLLLLYEHMRDYKSALEVLEPLDELGEDIRKEKSYLKTLMLLSKSELSSQEKINYLLEIYQESHELSYLVFEYLFRIKPAVGWENFDNSKSELLSDIFWQLDPKDLNLDIISKNGYLRELYSARGDVKLADSSSIFEFDLLIKLERKANATLAFEYICESCKMVYPFVFHRCSSCHAIATSKVEWRLTRDYHKDFSEENNSFQ
jgi:pentatricopeptide repeat protein